MKTHPLTMRVSAEKNSPRPEIVTVLHGFVIELEPGVWRALWDGDPGRTSFIRNAKIYRTEQGAKVALGMARNPPFRTFEDAKIVPVWLSTVDPEVSVRLCQKEDVDG